MANSFKVMRAGGGPRGTSAFCDPNKSGGRATDWGVCEIAKRSVVEPPLNGLDGEIFLGLVLSAGARLNAAGILYGQ